MMSNILDELETLSHLLVDLLKPVQKTMESNVCNSPFLNRTSLPLTLSISAAKTYTSHKNAASSRHKKKKKKHYGVKLQPKMAEQQHVM